MYGHVNNLLNLTSSPPTHTHSLLTCPHACRGATIEKCVEMLTDKLLMLWGGFSLAMGPLSSAADKINTKASKEQIISFFLTMYKTFVHPLIFVRLLRHRLSMPDPETLFDWSTKVKTNSPTIKPTVITSIPPEQLNVFKLISWWMESFPEDFVKYADLQLEVEQVILRLRSVRGAYLPHTHRLKSLLQDVNRPPNEGVVADVSDEKRAPHHENLFKLVSQLDRVYLNMLVMNMSGIDHGLKR